MSSRQSNLRLPYRAWEDARAAVYSHWALTWIFKEINFDRWGRTVNVLIGSRTALVI